MTSGQGRYAVELSHYEPVPPQVQQQLTSQHQVRDED
jgi:elongation factor G